MIFVYRIYNIINLLLKTKFRSFHRLIVECGWFKPHKPHSALQITLEDTTHVLTR